MLVELSDKIVLLVIDPNTGMRQTVYINPLDHRRKFVLPVLGIKRVQCSRHSSTICK